MFQKLILRQFGKFREGEFELGAISAFYGPNEAGKSTIFDAFLQALCRPPGNTLEGKRIRERYGEQARAELHNNAGAVESALSTEEFLATFAIHSGNVHFHLSGKSSFFQRAATELFEGDVHLDRAIKMMADEASTKGNLGPARARNRLRAEVDQLEEEYKLCENERRNCVRRQQAAEERGARIAELEQELGGADLALSQAEAALAEYATATRRFTLSAALRKLNQSRELQRELRDLQAYSKDEDKALDALIQAQIEHQAAAEAAQRQALTLRETEQNLSAELARLEQQSGPIQAEAKLAGEQLAALRGAGAKDRRLRPGVVALSLVLAGSGVAALVAAFFGAGVYGLIAGSVLLIGFLLHAVLRPHHTSALDSLPVSTLQEEWRRRNLTPPSANNRDEWETQLRGRENAVARFEERWNSLQERLSENARAITETAGKEQSAKLNLEEDNQRLIRWLNERHARSAAQYREKRQEWLKANERARQLAEELKTIYGPRDLEDLEVELQSELAQAGASGPKEAPDPERQRQLEKNVASARQHCEQLRKALAAQREQSAADRGETQGALSRILREWNEKQQRLLKARAELQRREQEQRAAGIAHRLLLELHQRHNDRTRQLVQAVDHSLARLFPEAQRVRINEGRAELDLQLIDGQGAARSIDHLSAGTRDSFFFALRLALAAKVGVDGRLLLLDEPFLTLDAKRSENALRYALHFAGEQGCQLVLLTKEESLLSMLQTLAPQTKVHRLQDVSPADNKGSAEGAPGAEQPLLAAEPSSPKRKAPRKRP